MPTLVTVLLSYLLGCFSTAYYLVRWRTGQDVRTLGSKNAGATNAWRVLGVWGFVVAFLGDMGKGVAALLLARALTGGHPWAVALAAPAVVAGHIWPVQLSFRGGEGFATALGAFAVLDPAMTGAMTALALILAGVTRKRSLAGLAALLGALLWTLALGRPVSQLVALLLTVPMMLWAFRRHLRRLLGPLHASLFQFRRDE